MKRSKNGSPDTEAVGAEIIAWNNGTRSALSDLPHNSGIHGGLHREIPAAHRVVYHWFDVYDLEEERINHAVSYFVYEILSLLIRRPILQACCRRSFFIIGLISMWRLPIASIPKSCRRRLW